MQVQVLVVGAGDAETTVAAALDAAGFRPRTAPDGQAARLMIRRSRPDIVLAATALADGSGEALLTGLRAAPDTAGLPLVLTGPRNAAGWEAAARAGADDYIPLTADRQILAARLRQIMRRRMALSELCAPEDGLAEAPAGFDMDALPAQPLRLLLIPDRDATRQAWTAALRRLSRFAPVAADGFGAFGALGPAREFDLVVIHGDADGGAGPGMIAALRSDLRTRNAALLFVAPDGAEGDAALAFDLGADDAAAGMVPQAELAARAALLLRGKLVADGRRSRLRDGLRQALFDPLTRLHNRRYADGRLARMIAEAASAGLPLTVMMVDIDDFKKVNDRLGHAAGDRVLCGVARWLRNSVRGADLLARVGGEEFLVAMLGSGQAEATAAAERLRLAVAGAAMPAAEDCDVCRVTVSIGIAAWDGTGAVTPADLLAEADRALYASKLAGRNRVTLYGDVAA